jgi:hypothetical protein
LSLYVLSKYTQYLRISTHDIAIAFTDHSRIADQNERRELKSLSDWRGIAHQNESSKEIKLTRVVKYYYVHVNLNMLKLCRITLVRLPQCMFISKVCWNIIMFWRIITYGKILPAQLVENTCGDPSEHNYVLTNFQYEHALWQPYQCYPTWF